MFLQLRRKEIAEMKEHDAVETAFKNGYEKGKTETAREIFAEIERFYDNRQSVYLTRSEFYTIKNKYISEGGEE